MKPHYLLLIACLFIGALQAKAVTNAGGNITYKAIDSVTYEVTVKLYVDCNGIAAYDDTLIVSWTGGSFKQKLSFIKSEDITGSFRGCGISSRCAGSFQYGFQEREYKTTVDISNTACEVVFGFNGGVRSSAITTGAAGTNAYLYAKLNKCFGLNNSARTSFSPQMLIPVGMDVALSTGYTDTIDGDSLAFELVSPESASGVQVAYSGAWSASKPISFLGFPNSSLNSPAGFQFDTQTGGCSFRPTVVNQQAVVVIRVYEYRRINGNMVEVGVTEIEQVVVVYASPNNKLPRIAYPYTAGACAGEEIVFDIVTDDPDNSDSTFLEWNNAISGASFIVDTSKRLAKATFRWTPTLAEVRTQPYIFIVRVRDNGCSPNGTSTRSISITVREKTDTKYLQIASKQSSCNRLKLVMADPAPSSVTRGFIVPDAYIRSSTKDEAEIYFDTAGWHKFAVWAKEGFNCPDTAWDSTFITLPYVFQVNHTPDSVVCPNQTINLIAQTQNGTKPYIYRWAYNGFLSPNVVYSFNANTKSALIDLRVIDSLGCYFHKDINITTHTLQAPVYHIPITVCKNIPPFLLTAQPKGGVWTGLGVVNDSIFKADTVLQPNNSVQLTYTFLDSNACASSGKTSIKIIPSPVLQFSAAPTQGVSPLKVDFFGLSFPEGNNWMWYFTNIITNKTDSIGGQLPTYTFTDSGEYNVTLKADTAGCVETYTKNKFIRVGDTTQSGGGNVWVRDINNQKIKIYPNPANNLLTIELADEIEEITLYDVHGKKADATAIQSTKSAQISVANLADGIYLVRIKLTNQNYISTKVFVLH